MTLVLNEELQTLLKEVRAKRNFNPEEWIEKKCTLFNEYMKKCGLKGCVVNVSGGIDSSVTAALIHHASKMPGSPITKLAGIAQPIHSTANIQGNAFILAEHLKLDLLTIDQTAIFDQLAPLVESTVSFFFQLLPLN